jgi:hypothetical protein
MGNQEWGREWPSWWPLEEPREPEAPREDGGNDGDGEESEASPGGAFRYSLRVREGLAEQEQGRLSKRDLAVSPRPGPLGFGNREPLYFMSCPRNAPGGNGALWTFT